MSSSPISAAPSPADVPLTVAPPPGAPRFPLFDGLRGIAVLLVVGYHVASFTGLMDGRLSGDVLIVVANQALSVFFALSGFLIYRPFVVAHATGKPLPRLRTYARRRAFRIVPGYWVALTLLAIWPGIVGPFSGDWWKYYGFLQVYSVDTIDRGIAPAWTLAVEVSFYVVLPLWAIALRRVRGRSWVRTELLALGGLVLAAIVVQVLSGAHVLGRLVAQALPGQAAWLGLGMALAVVSVAVPRGELPAGPARALAAHPTRCWLLSGACAAGLVALTRPHGLFGLIVAVRDPRPVATSVAAALLGLGFVGFALAPAVFGGDRREGVPRRVVALRPLMALGALSYGIYVWHLTVVEVLARREDPTRFSQTGIGLLDHLPQPVSLWLFLVVLAIAYAIASLSYRVIELPFMRRR